MKGETKKHTESATSRLAVESSPPTAEEAAEEIDAGTKRLHGDAATGDEVEDPPERPTEAALGLQRRRLEVRVRGLLHEVVLDPDLAAAGARRRPCGSGPWPPADEIPEAGVPRPLLRPGVAPQFAAAVRGALLR